MTAPTVWDEARSVKCRYCGAEADQPCVNAVTGEPSRRSQFVHPCRLVDAAEADPMGLSWPDDDSDPEPPRRLHAVPAYDEHPPTRDFAEPLWGDDE